MSDSEKIAHEENKLEKLVQKIIELGGSFDQKGVSPDQSNLNESTFSIGEYTAPIHIFSSR